MSDLKYLKRAIEVGNKVKAPYNFGAVIVKNNQLISADHAYVNENNDPSAHSEITAIRSAGEILKTFDLAGCTLYSSHEPCVMCFGCAAWAGIDRIVFASPASESKEVPYEFINPDIIELSKTLRRPMKVELIRVN